MYGQSVFIDRFSTVENQYPHMMDMYGHHAISLSWESALALHLGSYDVSVTKSEMINSVKYLLDCHAHFGVVNTSYSFSDFELTLFMGIKDFRKYVPSFKYTNRKGVISERFRVEDILALLDNEVFLDELLDVANSAKYISKRLLKAKKRILSIEYNGGLIIAWSSWDNISLMKCWGRKEYNSTDDGFTRIGELTVTTDDRVVGYVYTAEELANV